MTNAEAVSQAAEVSYDDVVFSFYDAEAAGPELLTKDALAAFPANESSSYPSLKTKRQSNEGSWPSSPAEAAQQTELLKVKQEGSRREQRRFEGQLLAALSSLLAFAAVGSACTIIDPGGSSAQAGLGVLLAWSLGAFGALGALELVLVC
ncbi:unnamed protein product [Polarella glacialis]|uniref:Uncharacterized protein n=1 Tax=Polarella glacialis TaxID=89957 RepID=A0A813LFU2_POLGL|nr:unnamed protein product [Polarella glacialis]